MQRSTSTGGPSSVPPAQQHPVMGSMGSAINPNSPLVLTQPASVGPPSTATTSAAFSNPTLVAPSLNPASTGPPSNNPQTPMQNPGSVANLGSVPPASQHALGLGSVGKTLTPASVQKPPLLGAGALGKSNEPFANYYAVGMPSSGDPIARVKQLILKDLREALKELCDSCAHIVEHQSRGQVLTNPPSITSIGPPASVKSVGESSLIGEPKSVDTTKSSPEKKPTAPVPLTYANVLDRYSQAQFHFFAICDLIEREFVLMQELCHKSAALERCVANCTEQQPKENKHVPAQRVTQVAENFSENADQLRKAFEGSLARVAALDDVVKKFQAKDADSMDIW